MSQNISPSDLYALNDPFDSDFGQTNGHLRARAIKHLDALDVAVKIFTVIALIFLGATVGLIALTLGSYVPPLSALYALGGAVAAALMTKAIDCCQQCVAKKQGLDLQHDYYTIKQPIPKEKNTKKSP